MNMGLSLHFPLSVFHLSKAGILPIIGRVLVYPENRTEEIMAKENKRQVAQAFRNFTQVFSRSTQAQDNSAPNIDYEDDLLQKKINSREQEYRRAILTSYSRYMNPFRALGKSSREAAAITEDENNLLKAYNLFKAFYEANHKIGDAETFISIGFVESPLTKKDAYTSGDDFIYLQCWLIFEQRVRDFIPVIEEVEEKMVITNRLKFVPLRTFSFSFEEREVIAAIEETYHPGMSILK